MADNNKILELERRIATLEQTVRQQASLISFFSGTIVFNKKVKFNANVYDASGGIVTEINNL